MYIETSNEEVRGREEMREGRREGGREGVREGGTNVCMEVTTSRRFMSTRVEVKVRE